MISVIIPVYNAAAYLEASLKSIINQTYSNLEIIIINDGSTDESDRIIKRFLKDSRIKYISRKNKGLVKSINEGLLIATGKYIGRMDADDISSLERLEKQVAFLEKNKVDLSGCLYSYIGDTSLSDLTKIQEELDIIKYLDSEKLVLGVGHSVCHPSFLFRKSILSEIGLYDEKFIVAEDLAFQLKFLNKGKKIKLLNEKLYLVRKHDMSKSAVENIDNAIETMKLRTDYIINNIIKSNSKVLIWAYGSGGRNLYKYLQKKYKYINVVGFVDSNKFGMCINNKKVYSPQQIGEISFDYIFIATSPGRIEVQKILNLKGYKPLKDYFCIYT